MASSDRNRAAAGQGDDEAGRAPRDPPGLEAEGELPGRLLVLGRRGRFAGLGPGERREEVAITVLGADELPALLLGQDLADPDSGGLIHGRLVNRPAAAQGPITRSLDRKALRPS